jgi:hypothetical protein
MKKDRYKLRVIALLIAVGFVGGLFVQYKAPGTFVFARHDPGKKKRQVAVSEALSDEGSAEIAPKGASLDGPPPSAAEQAEAAERKRREEAEQRAEAQRREEAEKQKRLRPDEITPALLRRYAAIATIIDNTLKIDDPGGETRYVYFAGRGVVADFGGGAIEARLWMRDDDHLCRGLGDDKRECFYLSVRLHDALRNGSVKTLNERIFALPEGAEIGSVEGFGAQKVTLLRGNARHLPGYVPLLEGKPGPEWTRDPALSGGGFVGALLLRHRGDVDRAATFFAPNGQVFEVSRLTRQTVGLWIGAWRRQDDGVCRQLGPLDGANAADPATGAPREECAHVKITNGRVEFAEAPPARRAFIREPWADEEPAQADRAAEQLSATSEVNLAPPTRSRAPINVRSDSFTDLR